MKITEEQYKKILEIQNISYNENSLWFEESLNKINELLNLSVVDELVSWCYNNVSLRSEEKELHKILNKLNKLC